MPIPFIDNIISATGNPILDADLLIATRNNNVQYVSVSGDNSNNGFTILEAVQTFEQAQTNLSVVSSNPKLILSLEASIFTLTSDLDLVNVQLLYAPMCALFGDISTSEVGQAIRVYNISGSGVVLSIFRDTDIECSTVTGNVEVGSGTHARTKVNLETVTGNFTIDASATGVIWCSMQVIGTVSIPSGVQIIGPGIFNSSGVKSHGNELETDFPAPGFRSITTSASISNSDNGSYINASISVISTLTFPDATTLDASFTTVVSNTSTSTQNLTLLPSVGTIDGVSNITLTPGSTRRILRQGSNYVTVSYGLGGVSLSGDVTGTNTSSTVERLRGRSLTTDVPSVGQSYTWTTQNNFHPGHPALGYVISSGSVLIDTPTQFDTFRGKVIQVDDNSSISLGVTTGSWYCYVYSRAETQPVEIQDVSGSVYEGPLNLYKDDLILIVKLPSGDVDYRGYHITSINEGEDSTGSFPILTRNNRSFIRSSTDNAFVTLRQRSVEVYPLGFYVDIYNDSNTDLTVQRQGSDTINAGTTATIPSGVINRIYLAFTSDGQPNKWIVLSGAGTGQLSGDVTGSESSNTVARIRGQNIVTTTPTEGQFLRFSSGSWTPNTFIPTINKTINVQTIAYTITNSDNFAFVIIDSSSNINITVPETSTESLIAGFSFDIVNRGSGDVTIVREGSDSLQGNTLIASGDNALIYKEIAGTPNTWRILGGTDVIVSDLEYFRQGSIINGTYLVRLRIPYSGVIISTTTQCESGSATGTFQIVPAGTGSAVSLGGTANSISTTRNVQNHTTNNVFNPGDDIQIVITSASSLQNLHTNFEVSTRL